MTDNRLLSHEQFIMTTSPVSIWRVLIILNRLRCYTLKFIIYFELIIIVEIFSDDKYELLMRCRHERKELLSATIWGFYQHSNQLGIMYFCKYLYSKMQRNALGPDARISGNLY